jgi:hypothetical protein
VKADSAESSPVLLQHPYPTWRVETTPSVDSSVTAVEEARHPPKARSYRASELVVHGLLAEADVERAFGLYGVPSLSATPLADSS